MRSLISIVIPSFNYADTLPEAIESVLAQTYKHWELLIVDDGSSDGSFEIIRSYERRFPKKIKSLRHRSFQNLGLAATLQLGVSVAKGSWIAFLEADDSWTKDTLKKRVEGLRRHPAAIAIFNAVKPIGDPHFIGRHQNSLKRDGMDYFFSKRPRLFSAIATLIDGNHFLTFSAAMAKRKSLLSLDWNTNVGPCLDWWIFSQLSILGNFLYLPQPVTRWRIHSKSYNALHQDPSTRLNVRLMMYEKQKQLLYEYLRTDPVHPVETWISRIDGIIAHFSKPSPSKIWQARGWIQQQGGRIFPNGTRRRYFLEHSLAALGARHLLAKTHYLT